MNRLQKFTEDHLGRLTVNNSSGLFTTILNDTQAAYTAFFGKMADGDLAFSVQQSLTMSADNLLETFKKEISKHEGTVRSLYGVDTPDYIQFFPRGIAEYSWSNKKNVEVLMERFVHIANAHSADVGVAFINLFTNIQSNYKTARDSQLLKIGEVAVARVKKRSTRHDLEVQLCKNIYYIGFQFPTNTKKCMSFFDQSILHYRIRSATDGKGRLTGIIRSNGVPVANAIVEYIDIKVRKAKSKVDGAFRTPSVLMGLRKVRISKLNYKSVELEVVVEDKGDTKLDVELVAE